ncbi:MAG: hypothetical protein K8I27_03065 [Planctomycetes bacterium]|nr:hypothetical protein [Planctomycetota bacterium]
MKMLIPAILMLLAPMLNAQIGFESEDEVVETSFKLADANKDGKISSTEARELRVKFFTELKEAVANKDEDAADEKTAEVEMKYEAAEYVLTPYLFAALDTNRDQKLAKAELKVVEESEYEEITSDKVMDFVLEEEWQLLSDVFGTGKDKEFDHEVLKKMAAETELRYTAEMYAQYLYMGLYETLMDFELADLEEGDKDESGEEKKDLTKVKVTKKEALKLAIKMWKETEKGKSEPDKDGTDKKDAKNPEKKGARK